LVADRAVLCRDLRRHDHRSEGRRRLRVSVRPPPPGCAPPDVRTL
jgi:hypothetical protein